MNIAVIFAGGVGSRMKTGGIPKQFLEVSGKPILAHTLSVFDAHDEIDAIVLVMVESWIAQAEQLVKEYGFHKVARVVAGGETGQLSIYNGLVAAQSLACADDASRTIVLVHDGVRPVIDADLLSANIAGVKEHGSAITCVPCKETVVMVDEAGSQVMRTVERAKTRIAKAPQSFYLDELLAAHERALAAGRKDVIDSCTMMQMFGAISPAVVEGSFDNIKVTTPEDYYTLKVLLDFHSGNLEEV